MNSENASLYLLGLHPGPRWGSLLLSPQTPCLIYKTKTCQNKANEVFEILPLIIFVHHAGGMQTRGTPSTPVLIWSLTNDIAPEAYLGGGGIVAWPLPF